MGINSRRLGIVGIVAAALLALAACTNYPDQHEPRLRKAAGVVTFRINCSKDLWERTRRAGYDGEVKAKAVKDIGNGMASVELSGPQLVDYLDVLSDDAFGWHGRDPLSERMYNAIAPVVDKIRGPLTATDPVPEVTLNDVVAPASSSAVSPAVSKSE